MKNKDCEIRKSIKLLLLYILYCGFVSILIYSNRLAFVPSLACIGFIFLFSGIKKILTEILRTSDFQKHKYGAVNKFLCKMFLWQAKIMIAFSVVFGFLGLIGAVYYTLM